MIRFVFGIIAMIIAIPTFGHSLVGYMVWAIGATSASFGATKLDLIKTDRMTLISVKDI